MKKAFLFLVTGALCILAAGGAAHAEFGFVRTFQANTLGNLVGTRIGAYPGSQDMIICGYYSGESFFGGEFMDSAGGASQGFLARMDSRGWVKWVREIRGTGDQRAYGAAVDQGGNIYVTGRSTGTAVFAGGSAGPTPVRGDTFVFVAKYSSAGDLLWVRHGDASWDAGGSAVAVDASGAVYVGGWVFGTGMFGSVPVMSEPAPNSFLAKYDALSGEVKWVRTAVSGQGSRIHDMAVHSGAVTVAGEFLGTVVFGTHQLSGTGDVSSGNTDAFVVRYNAAGEAQWAERSGGEGVDAVYGVASDPSGDVLVVGRTSSETAVFGDKQLAGAGQGDGFVARYDETGNVLWVAGFGGPGEDSAKGVSVKSSGRIAVTGEFSGTVAVAGRELKSRGGKDVFAAFYSPSGAFISGYAGGGAGDDAGRSAAWQEEMLVVAGGFEGSAIFGDDNLSTHTSFEMGELFVSLMGDILPSGAIAGDFTGDRRVDLADIIAILRMLTFAGGDAPPGAIAADMTGNGRVGMEDAIAILQYIAFQR